MIKNKKIILPIIFVLIVITVIGVTYSFFNYTRTGLANTLKVGRIYFNHEQGNTINIANVFPITSEQAETDTTNAKTLSITVTGDTDYDKGIEYLLTLDSINNIVNNKKVPINLEVTVTGEGLGTEEPNDYYTNRDNYTTSKYKKEYSGTLEDDRHILVGYIAPNETLGTIEGINGTINIKAYLDKDKVAISDTYPESELGYKLNSNMTQEEMNACVEYVSHWKEMAGSSPEAFCSGLGKNSFNYTFNEMIDNNLLTDDRMNYFIENNIIVYNNYANGTTDDWINGRIVLTTEEWNSFATTPLSFKVKVEANEGIWVEKEAAPASCFITSGLVTRYVRNPDMDVNTCVSKLTELWGEEVEGETVDTGETYEAFCNGTGTNRGENFQDAIDNYRFGPRDDSSTLKMLSSVDILLVNHTTSITDYDASCGSDVVIPSKINIKSNDGYIRNPNMDINACVNKFTEWGYNEYLQEGETLEAFCDGTGTLMEMTLQQALDQNGGDSELESAGIIIPNTTTIQANVIEIASNSFENKTLTSVTIPNSVTTIGDSAFKNNQLTTVEIPSSVVTDVCFGIFDFGVNLTRNGRVISCTTPTRCFTSTVDNNEVTITNYDENCGTDVIIPSTIDGLPVTVIASSAFRNKELTNVTIPNGIKKVSYAFLGNQLTNVTIPSSVTEWCCNSFDEGVIINNQSNNSCTALGNGICMR